MTTLLTAILAFTLPFTVTKEDLRKLLDAGVSDQTIIEYIRSNGPAEPLSVEDVTDLKKAGASDSILRAMLEASRTSEAMTPSHPPADRSTTTTYYSYPSYSYSSYDPYYYPYYSYYPSLSFSYSYYPRSYYRYPYSYAYPRYNHYSYPHSVSPYRGHHPQTVQPRHGAGPYRR